MDSMVGPLVDQNQEAQLADGMYKPIVNSQGEPTITSSDYGAKNTFDLWPKTKLAIETKEKEVYAGQAKAPSALSLDVSKFMGDKPSYGQFHSWARPFLTTDWHAWRIETTDEEASKLGSGVSTNISEDKSTDKNPDPYPYPRLNTDLEDKENKDWGTKFGPNKRKYRRI